MTTNLPDLSAPMPPHQQDAGNSGTGTDGPAADSPAPLTRLQKAAVIVQVLLEGGQAVPLSHVSAARQADLARVMADLRYVDQATLHAVVREFTAELERVGISFPDGLDRVLSMLEGHISTQAADELRQGRNSVSARDNPWVRLASLDITELLPLLEGESPSVAAIIASKLSTDKAAQMLEKTAGPRAREIALAIPVIAATHPETVERIGQTLAGRLDARPPSAFRGDPAQRIGAILNRAPSETRETLLQDLISDDPGFAAQVRRNMFTFNDIPTRVVPRDVVKITRAVDEPVLIEALVAAGDSAPDAVEFILGNIAKRMAEQLNDAITEHAPVKRKDGDIAMDRVMQAIRDLEASGELTLIAIEEDDEDG